MKTNSSPRLRSVSPLPTDPPRRGRTHSKLDVIGQVRAAFAKGPLAAALGLALGGGVPVCVYRMVHFELAILTSWRDLRVLKAIIVIGGLLFSANKVWTWGRMAFQSPLLATGFVLLAEGTLTFSNEPYLSLGALAYLVLINSIATACTLATGDRS